MVNVRPVGRHDMEEESESCGLDLGFAEARVLGSLLEKEATTPDYYPMTLNSLQAACNQRSNREPVSALSEAEVEEALEGLRSKQLAVKVHLAGSRSPKYKHTIDRVLNLDEAQRALICVLLLRGRQTAGELKQRTERMHAFSGVPAVEHALGTLIDASTGAMVARLPAGQGRRVETFVHLLGGGVETDGGESVGRPVSAEEIMLEEEVSWRKRMEGEVAELREEVSALRAKLDELLG